MMKFVSVLFIVMAATGCGKDKKTDDQPAGDDGIDGPGTLALEFDANITPSKSLETLAASLTAIPQSDMGGQLVSAGTVAISLTGSEYNDGECNGNGYPIAKEGEPKQEDGRLPYTHAQYPQRHFYCMVKVGTSPETLLGSIVINKGVICALEKAGAMEESKFGTDQSLKISINEECFSKEFVEQTKSEGMTEMSVVAKFEKLTDHPKWDLRLTFDGGDAGDSIYYFRNTKDFLSGARVDKTEGGSYGPGYVYTLSTDGFIRFENRLGPSAGSGFTGSQHIRLLIEGELDKETKTIGSIKRYEGASANLPGGSSGSLVTVKGTLQDGLRARGYSCSGEGENSTVCSAFANYTQTANTCIGTSDCQGNDGIQLTQATFGFMLPGEPADNMWMSDFLEQVNIPLAFSSVTLDNIPQN